MTRRRVLLLHHPVHRVHMCVVTSLAQFLEQHCNIDVSLDIRDIPHTENKVRITMVCILFFTSIQVLASNRFCSGVKYSQRCKTLSCSGNFCKCISNLTRFLYAIIKDISWINTVQLKICICIILLHLCQISPKVIMNFMCAST
jgi:hypothetical protein